MTTETKTIHAKESGHWYDREGNPQYTYINKKGEEKPTTLREARKYGYVPGVTTIINEAAKPNLIRWQQEQVLLAALTLPRIEGETEEEYVARIIMDSQEQSRVARERGIQIHAWVQQGFSFAIESLCEEGKQFFNVAWDELSTHIDLGFWKCEVPFATDRYGGKVDLRIINGWGDIESECVIDIKTTEKPLATLTTWPEHHMQLAAYREGLGLSNAKCGILYVCTKEIDARLVWVEEKDLQKGWGMFCGLLGYWYARTQLVS